jgi:hypothetical protein
VKEAPIANDIILFFFSLKPKGKKEMFEFYASSSLSIEKEKYTPARAK